MGRVFKFCGTKQVETSKRFQFRRVNQRCITVVTFHSCFSIITVRTQCGSASTFVRLVAATTALAPEFAGSTAPTSRRNYAVHVITTCVATALYCTALGVAEMHRRDNVETVLEDYGAGHCCLAHNRQPRVNRQRHNLLCSPAAKMSIVGCLPHRRIIIYCPPPFTPYLLHYNTPPVTVLTTPGRVYYRRWCHCSLKIESLCNCYTTL